MYMLCTVACIKFYNCFSVMRNWMKMLILGIFFFLMAPHTAPLSCTGAVLTLSRVSLLQVSVGAPELCQKLK